MLTPRPEENKELPEVSLRTITRAVCEDGREQLNQLAPGAVTPEKVRDILSEVCQRMRQLREFEQLSWGSHAALNLKRDYRLAETVPVEVTSLSHGSVHVGDGSVIKSFRLLPDNQIAVLDASGQVQVLGRTSDGVWNRRFVWNRLDSAAIEVIPQVGLVAILKTGNVVVFSQHASGRWSSSISCDDNGARGGQPGLGIRAHHTGFYSLSFSAVASWSRQPDLRYTAKIMFEFPGLKCFSPAPTGEFLTASVTKTLLWWCPDGRGRFHATSLGEMSSSPSAVGSLPSGILFSIDSLGEILTFDRSSTHKVPALAQRSSLGVADVRAVQVTARDELIVHNPDGVHVFAADVNERWRRTHFVRLIPKQGARPGEARVNASHMVPDGRIIAATSDGSGECELQILDGISG